MIWTAPADIADYFDGDPVLYIAVRGSNFTDTGTYTLTVIVSSGPPVLISNLEQTSLSTDYVDLADGGEPGAQSFTTGPRTGGYALTGITVVSNGTGSALPAGLVATIRADSGGNPGATVLATLTNPASLPLGVEAAFTAPANTTLAADTTYWVHFTTTGTLTLQHVSNGQYATVDAGAAAGWSMGKFKFYDSGSWLEPSSGAGVDSAIRLKVSGMAAIIPMPPPPPQPPQPPPQPPDPPGPGGGGGGGGGPRQTVPDAPRNLLVEGGDGQVTLTWDVPEDDGGSAITDYEYRIDGRGRWISIGSTDTTHTVAGLVNGTAYVFQVRAVNGIGRSPASGPAEATPGVGALDFAHFANGAGIISDLVFVNVATHPIRPVLYFYDQEGHPMDPESVVDLTEDLEVTEDGALTVRTAMEPLGELTVSTHGRGNLVSGSVAVAAKGPIGGVLRFDLPDIGVAGVGASPPVRDALFPARRQAGGIRTAAALHNLGEEAITVSCRLMSGGRVLEAVEIDLEANGQEARYIEELFTATDTSDFVGSVRCTAPGRFTGIAVELDEGNCIFTTLPVVPVARAGGGGQETVLYFAHFANGGGTTSDLVFVNVSPRPSGPGPTPYHAAVSPSRPALYFYDQEGNLMDPASVVDLTGDLEVTGDGALSIQTEMEPLGELTISTHGRGELVSGSVTVVSEGSIGGVLRYALPGIGVTGVGASPPVRDALFPVRQEGGLDTAAAIHNLTGSDLVVTCRLMKDGAVLEETEIPLAANGQEARYIEEMFTFTGADRSDFVGSVRCTVPPGEAMFTGVAVELDAGNQIFTTLPVVPVERATDSQE